MFAASVLTGVEAFGYSIIEVCKGPTKTISDFEQHYESYRKRAELGQMRNNSLMNWVTTAPAEDVSEVWGEPELYEGRKAWIVQLEPHPRIYSDIFERDGKICFNYDTTNVRSYVFVDFETGKISRRVHNIIHPHP